MKVQDIYRTFFDVEKLYDDDDAFVDLIDNEAMLPLLSLICGGGGTSLEYNATYGSLRFGGQGGRVVPPDINPEGYCPWHRDFPAPDAWPRPKGRLVKVSPRVCEALSSTTNKISAWL